MIVLVLNFQTDPLPEKWWEARVITPQLSSDKANESYSTLEQTVYETESSHLLLSHHIVSRLLSLCLAFRAFDGGLGGTLPGSTLGGFKQPPKVFMPLGLLPLRRLPWPAP